MNLTDNSLHLNSAKETNESCNGYFSFNMCFINENVTFKKTYNVSHKHSCN